MATIQQLRKQARLTQQELADRLQVARITVAYWETGERHPSRRNQRKLALYFQVPADQLQFVGSNGQLRGDFIGRYAGFASPPKSA